MKKKLTHILAIAMLPIFMLATITWIKHKHVCLSQCVVKVVNDECCSPIKEVEHDNCCEEEKIQSDETHCNIKNHCCYDETLVLDSNMGEFEKHESISSFQFMPNFIASQISNNVVYKLCNAHIKAKQRHPRIKPGPRKNILFCCFRC